MALKCCTRIFPVLSRQISHGKLLLSQVHSFKISLLPAYNLTKSIGHYGTNVAKVNVNLKESTKQRVYYGVLATQIKTVKIFSLTTSLAGLVAQPVVYKELAATQGMPIILGVCTFIGFFTFVTPLLLHYITKKYVIHLDYKPATQTYVATTLNFFSRPKQIEFSVQDVHVPDVPGMFTTFEIQGNGLFLDPRLFEDPSHYAKIMGYDKPIDFKLYETSEKKAK